MKRPRRITKRDLTEYQFMAVLKQVCQPLKKPIQSSEKGKAEVIHGTEDKKLD
jgi:hypothetical protein